MSTLIVAIFEFTELASHKSIENHKQKVLMNHLKQLSRENNKLIRFIFVGAINTLINYVVFLLAVEISNLVFLSLLISTFTSMAIAYRINRMLVWNSFTRNAYPLRFIGLQLTLISLNWGILVYMDSKTGLSHVEAQAIVLPMIALASFLGSEFWVYTRK